MKDYTLSRLKVVMALAFVAAHVAIFVNFPADRTSTEFTEMNAVVAPESHNMGMVGSSKNVINN